MNRSQPSQNTAANFKRLKIVLSQVRTGRDGRTINTANIGTTRRVEAVMHHEAKAAKGRKEKGREKGGKTGGRNRKKENSLVENLPQSFGEDEGKARDLAGKKLGVSGKRCTTPPRTCAGRPGGMIRLLAHATQQRASWGVSGHC